jgi:transposase-like protein
MASRRKFTQEFKLAAVERLRAGKPVGLLARSLEADGGAASCGVGT